MWSDIISSVRRVRDYDPGQGSGGSDGRVRPRGGIFDEPAPAGAPRPQPAPRTPINAGTPIEEIRARAQAGEADAQYSLGLRYDNGQGVAQDFTEAVRWYRLAAEQGNPAAQYNLGAMYSNGQGVPRDVVEAYKWRSLAASRAPSDDQQRYAETRDALAERLSPDQLAEAEKRVADWEADFARRKRQ